MKVAQFLSTALKPGTGTGGSSPALALQAEAQCRKVEVFPLSSFCEQSEICLGANRSSPVFSGVAVVCFGYISCLPLVSCWSGVCVGHISEWLQGVWSLQRDFSV